jgi:translation initiation factor IF-3
MMAVNQPQNKYTRINDQIRVPQVRLFIDDKPLGVVSIEEARRQAFQLGLDLVETVPNAKPPVCKILDFGKFKYEEKIRQKEDSKKQKAGSHKDKEIQLRYCTGEHDLVTKVNAIKKFLEENRNVHIVMKFKNREMAFKRMGEELLQKVGKMVEEVGTLVMPRFIGKNLVAQVTPK